MKIPPLVLGALVFSLGTSSQAQLHVEPKSWPGSMSSEQTQQLMREVQRAQLSSLEVERRCLLQNFPSSSSRVRQIEKQIRQLRDQMKSGSSPKRLNPESEQRRRKFFATEIARLQQEKRSLLRKFKPNSPVIALLNAQIRRLREEEFSAPNTRLETEYLSS